MNKPATNKPARPPKGPGRPAAAPATALDADIRPGQSVELLKELHILTRDGKLNQDSRRKLKQVYHLYQFIEKLLLEIPPSEGGPGIVDHGAGKSYLGFILYDLFLKPRGAGHMYGVETRPELVDRSKALAQRLGFDRMGFLHLSAADAVHSDLLPATVDMVTALHACDTATDDAIDFGLARNARYLVLVPCCQAEVAASLRQNKALSLARTPLAELWRHPIHTRELGSQLTNVLRCLYLEACGSSAGSALGSRGKRWASSPCNPNSPSTARSRCAALRLRWPVRLAMISSFFRLCSQPTSSVTVT